MGAYLQMRSSKAVIDTMKTYKEREIAPDRDNQPVDGKDHQEGTGSPVC